MEKYTEKEDSKLYSYNELVQIGTAVDGLLVKAKEQKYNRKLVYFLSKNLKNIQDEIKNLQEGIEQLPKAMNSYTDELKEIALANGGVKIKNDQGGFNVDVQTEDFDKEAFEKESEAVEEKYEGMLNEANKIKESNEKYKKEEISDVYLYKLKLDIFPEELNLDDMPFALIDLIEE